MIALLREVRYLLLLNISVPERALSIFKKHDVYHSQIMKADLIVQTYNKV